MPFALTRHHRRLERSAAGLGLPPLDLAVVDKGVAAVLDGPAIDFGRLRYSVTGGVGPLGSDRDDTLADLHRPRGAAATPSRRAGKLTVVPWTRNERSAVVGLKTTSYAENVVALARAKQVGAVEAVFGNTRGELCECTGSNVFVVVDGVVLTPPAESGLLLGITRELTIEWGRAAGIEVREETLPLDVLQQRRRGLHHELDQGRPARSTPSTTGTSRRPPRHDRAAAGLPQQRRAGQRPVTGEDRTRDETVRPSTTPTPTSRSTRARTAGPGVRACAATASPTSSGARPSASSAAS